MSETIWIATDVGGSSYLYCAKMPTMGVDGAWCGDYPRRYDGPNKPPPGECWEILQMRKGDIDTDGDPIGWKIVGIGKDGSVLCEKGNGQRRRYLFGDGTANGKPSGEAWERLVEACREYERLVPCCGPQGREIQAAIKAYEAAESAEPSDQQATIERLTKERDEAKEQMRDTLERLAGMTRSGGSAYLSEMLDKVNAELHRLKREVFSLNGKLGVADATMDRLTKERDSLEQRLTRTIKAAVAATWDDDPQKLDRVLGMTNEVEQLTKERDEALRELANEKARSGQVTTAQINVIVELQEQIHKLKVESATQTDAISEREDRIDQLSGEVQRLTARLERPEMPKCVRELLEYAKEANAYFDMLPLSKAVEAHYAPPFKIDKLGWYLASDGKEWRVAEICGNTAWGRNACDWYGFCTDPKASRPKQLTKYLRPLEG